METSAVPTVAIFLLVLVAAGSHAAMSPEAYWNSVLPNTPMPSAIANLLHTGVTGEKTSVSVGSGGVYVNAGGTTVGVGHKGVGVDVNGGHGGGTTVGVGHKGVGVNVNGHHGGGTHVGVGGGGVNVHTIPKKKPVYVHGSPFMYNYAATADQLKENSDVAVFFVEKDLHAGAKMNLHFTRTTVNGSAGFLPRTQADEIPFSSKKTPEILERFGIEPNSEDTQIVVNTIRECEGPKVEGERRVCATSLESMVDFATTTLGSRKLVTLSTTMEKEKAPKQVYTISPGVKKFGDRSKAVVCHAEPYIYAVFFCHSTRNTRAYVVPMVAADGSKVEAAVVCHTDTAKWNPRHLAFQMLKVRPGTVPVCHFLPEDHVLWSAAN